MRPFVLLLLLAACTPTINSSPRETTVRAQIPVRVTWTEVSRDDHSAQVALEVNRVSAMDLPFTVHLDLPAGVTAKEGRTDFVLEPNTVAGTVRERYVFTFDALPTLDVVAHVDGENSVMGSHSNVPYRFGRAALELIAPKASQAGYDSQTGRNLGRTIPIKP